MARPTTLFSGHFCAKRLSRRNCSVFNLSVVMIAVVAATGRRALLNLVVALHHADPTVGRFISELLHGVFKGLFEFQSVLDAFTHGAPSLVPISLAIPWSSDLPPAQNSTDFRLFCKRGGSGLSGCSLNIGAGTQARLWSVPRCVPYRPGAEQVAASVCRASLAPAFASAPRVIGRTNDALDQRGQRLERVRVSHR